MPDDVHGDAEEKVAATTAGYGGPVSDDELAEVWLPEGQREASSGRSSTDVAADQGDDAGAPGGADTPDGVEPPD